MYFVLHFYYTFVALRFQRPFRYVNFEQDQNKYCEVVIMKHPIRFYTMLKGFQLGCWVSVAVPATIHGVLTKISKRSRIVAQWNGVLADSLKNE